MSEMKFEKAKRNKNYDWVYNRDDPVFGNWLPNFSKAEDAPVEMMELHPEIKKMLFSDLYEKPDNELMGDIENERDAQLYEDTRDLAINYYNAKL
jgi:hypothetical protein